MLPRIARPRDLVAPAAVTGLPGGGEGEEVPMAPGGRKEGRLGRWWRRWGGAHRRGRDAGLRFVYSDHYALGPVFAGLDTRRGQRILSFLDAQKVLRRGRLYRPRRIPVRELLRVHDEAYLRSLETAEGLARATGIPIGAERVDEILRAERAMAGGTWLAARRALREDRIFVNLGGGLHHAGRDRGQGFCLFNDVAVAIAALRARGFAGRVLVVDLDLHDGEGTRSIFAEDAGVHTYSVHNRTLRRDEAVESTSIELGSGVDDATYLRTLEGSLPSLIERFDPELAFYVAGTDVAEDDRFGDWEVSAEGIVERDRRVTGWLRGGDRRRHLVLVLGGGYGENAWRPSARFLAEWALGRRVEPPVTENLPLKEYRRLARHLGEPLLGRERPQGPGWRLTADDLPGLQRQATPRVLGAFGLYEIELALERLGLLDKVRALGHESLRLEADLDHPLGHTLRLVSTEPARQVVLELRGRIDAAQIRGLRLLSVEWLLAQNPGADFPRHRPELPGQRHPGTGLLRDVAALLVLGAERMGLDGVCFVPSHVSLVLLSWPHARAVEPEVEARLQALFETLGERPFREALRLIEEGRVREVSTGEAFRWEPAPVLMPVGRRARAWLGNGQRRRRVEEVRARLEYEISP